MGLKRFLNSAKTVLKINWKRLPTSTWKLLAPGCGLLQMVSSLAKCCLFVFIADKSSNITKNSSKPSCFLSVYQWSFKQSIEIFCFTWHNPILYNFRASHFSKLCKLRLFLELKIGEETKFVWILRFPYFFIFLVSGRATGPVIQGNPTSLYFFLVKGEYFLS